jgi:hypothetical protein
MKNRVEVEVGQPQARKKSTKEYKEYKEQKNYQKK